MEVTPYDHISLQKYRTTHHAGGKLTPEEAANIHRLMKANSFPKQSSIIWHYPVDNQGYPVEGHERLETPIRKARPNSIESQQPWLKEGKSRAAWYQSRAAGPQYDHILSVLPEWMTKAEGLNLYRVLASLAHTHRRNIDDLWRGVGEVLHRASGEPPAFKLTRADGGPVE